MDDEKNIEGFRGADIKFRHFILTYARERMYLVYSATPWVWNEEDKRWLFSVYKIPFIFWRSPND